MLSHPEMDSTIWLPHSPFRFLLFPFHSIPLQSSQSVDRFCLLRSTITSIIITSSCTLHYSPIQKYPHTIQVSNSNYRIIQKCTQFFIKPPLHWANREKQLKALISTISPLHSSADWLNPIIIMNGTTLIQNNIFNC